MRIGIAIARSMPNEFDTLLAVRLGFRHDAIAEHAKGGTPRAHVAASTDNPDAKTESIVRVFDNIAPGLSGTQLTFPLL
jgi:hypothetical protein